MRMIILAVVATGVASSCQSSDVVPREADMKASGSAGFPALLKTGHVDIAVRDAPADDIQRRLTFRVFENGANDLIYVGLQYGMWSRGEFDLRLFDKLIYTGHIEHLLYEDVLINMGDVLAKDPGDGLRVTRISGWFK